MIIINKGVYPKPPRRWWLEVEIFCPRCGTIFKLEEGDTFCVIPAAERHYEVAGHIKEPGSVTCDCPVCNYPVRQSDNTN
jgi:hypothetical protein